MKKVISILISTVMIFYSVTVFADLCPRISVPQVEAQAGESVDVTISVIDNPGVVTMRLDVTYDKEVMTLTNVTDHALLPGKMHSGDYSLYPYCLYWDNGASSTDYVSGGNLVTLTFKLNDDVENGTYDIDLSYNLDDYDVFNSSLEPVDFMIENGGVIVDTITEPEIRASDLKIGDTISFSMEALSPEGVSGKLIAATYDKDKLHMYDYKICDAAEYQEFRGVELDGKNAEILQIMWLKDLTSFTPVTVPLTISLSK